MKIFEQDIVEEAENTDSRSLLALLPPVDKRIHLQRPQHATYSTNNFGVVVSGNDSARDVLLVGRARVGGSEMDHAAGDRGVVRCYAPMDGQENASVRLAAVGQNSPTIYSGR